jgi:hypothetical protein
VLTRLAKSALKRFGWTLTRSGTQPMCAYPSARYIDTVDLSLPVYDHQAEAVELVRTCAPYTMTTLARMMSLYQLCRHIELTEVEGDLVECGVWRGGSAGIMAGANLRHGSRRRQLWLYDSFEGLPAATAADGRKAIELVGGKGGGELASTNVCVAPEQDVVELLNMVGYPRADVHIIKGWFQDTVARNKPARIALLRLDGDWYESTKVCLDHLYPLVVPGGIVVIDDYGDWEGCRKAVDEYFAAHQMLPLLHHVDRTCRYFVKD